MGEKSIHNSEDMGGIKKAREITGWALLYKVITKVALLALVLLLARYMPITFSRPEFSDWVTLFRIIGVGAAIGLTGYGLAMDYKKYEDPAYREMERDARKRYDLRESMDDDIMKSYTEVDKPLPSANVKIGLPGGGSARAELYQESDRVNKRTPGKDRKQAGHAVKEKEAEGEKN